MKSFKKGVHLAEKVGEDQKRKQLQVSEGSSNSSCPLSTNFIMLWLLY